MQAGRINGVTPQLAPEEPEAGPWRVVTLSAVMTTLMRNGPQEPADGRPVVIAVDGRSASGKTTLTARLQGAVPGSAVVHTDDIAWSHSRFGWADLLVDGVLRPVHRGAAVSFRPPAWVARGREGSIEVPAGCPLLLVEGVGCGRREVASLIDALVWVQSDEQQARERDLGRVGTPGGAATVQFMHDWMAEEIPFVAADRAWERADLIVCGTPQLPHDPRTELVVARPRHSTPADAPGA
jgi:hypothetical protein